MISSYRLTAGAVAAALVCLTHAGHADPGESSRKPGPMRDVIKNDELSQRLRMEQQKDPIHDLGPAIGKSDVDPSVVQSTRSFIKDSAILSFRGDITFIPKRAILYLPDQYKDRVGLKPNSEVMTWGEFSQKNRGWVRSVEVTRDQAMGKTPLSESMVEAYQNSGAIVVATFRNGPISVLPPKPAEDPETASTAGPPATITQ